MKTVLPTGYAGMETHVALEDGNLIAGTRQDCDPILEDAKARHNAGMFGSSEMRHAARLPLVVVETYCNVHGITFEDCMNDPKHFRAMLSDPDLSAFRIWTGRVS